MEAVVAKNWVLADIDPELRERLSRETTCSELLADLLIRRGIADAGTASTFLDPKLLHLCEPERLPDVDTAALRIVEALRSDQTIAIFGDYDVDGMSSTCLLLDLFRQIGKPVIWRLPHRLREGYGLRNSTVDELAEQGVELLITVDNGSSSYDEIERAREHGIDAVIVDHHQPSERLPRPVAHVNPWLAEDPGGLEDLAGVGVTFKLVWAICQRFSKSKKLSAEFRQFLMDSLALVALGTIADVVPLRGENRVLVKFGLRGLRSSTRPGLRELVSTALRSSGAKRPGNLRDLPALEASDIGFRIGPRLNAVGRLGEPEVAIRLLSTEDPEEARRLMRHLEEENQRRRQIEAEITEEARRRVREEHDVERERAIVLGGEDWHPGVIGIVASRLTDEFFRPTFLFTRREGPDGVPTWRGSARSIPAVHLVDTLARAREYGAADVLLQFGGHAMAAGAEVAFDGLDILRAALQQAVEVAPADMVPELDVDGALSLESLGAPLLDELGRLSPHGAGNPEPIFAARDVEVVGAPRVLGKDGKHLSFHVRQRGGRAAFRAIAFGMGERFGEIRKRGTQLEMLFRPEWNSWQGQREIQLRVRDLRVL